MLDIYRCFDFDNIDTSEQVKAKTPRSKIAGYGFSFSRSMNKKKRNEQLYLPQKASIYLYIDVFLIITIIYRQLPPEGIITLLLLRFVHS